MRRQPDVYVWPRRHSRDRRTKRGKRNAVALQEIDERLTFGSIRIQRHVHGITMIKPPLIVNSSLTEHRDWQRPLESLLKKCLDLTCLGKDP